MTTPGVRSSDTTREGDVATLVPPQLPPFLATVFDLQPIVGVPSDEEARLIHGAIRSLNSLLHSPELRDSLTDLSTELTQYLFDVQMVRHREKYAVGIFSNEIVYAPPNLPSHVPITLETVTGPPTDDQLRSAHAALRVADSLMSVPSPVHIDLNMELSQHLFDLQFARHVQRSTRLRSPASRLPPQGVVHPVGPPPTSSRIDHLDAESTAAVGAQRLGAEISLETPLADDIGTQSSSVHGSDNDQPRESSTARADDRIGPDQNRELLTEMSETLKNINRVLIASQNSLARGFNSSVEAYDGGYTFGDHSLINSKGETPEMRGLHTLVRFNCNSNGDTRLPSQLDASSLAQYLQFYDIGLEMIEEGDEPKVKSGMEENARDLLSQRV